MNNNTTEQKNYLIPPLVFAGIIQLYKIFFLIIIPITNNNGSMYNDYGALYFYYYMYAVGTKFILPITDLLCFIIAIIGKKSKNNKIKHYSTMLLIFSIPPLIIGIICFFTLVISFLIYHS